MPTGNAEAKLQDNEATGSETLDTLVHSYLVRPIAGGKSMDRKIDRKALGETLGPPRRTRPTVARR